MLSRGMAMFGSAARTPKARRLLSDAPAPLTDAQGRRHDYLRISLTERCNLRCQYCMPAAGVPLTPREQLLSSDEVVALARVFCSLGVRRLRLTGGEPSLRPDLPALLARLAALPGAPRLALTSNGVVLARRLAALRAAGLTELNVSLDSLRPERYERMARRAALPRVLATLDMAAQLEMPVKLNVVLIKDFNDDEILDFVELTRERALEVRFIEFMPFSGNEWGAARLVPYRAALRVLAARHAGLRALAPRAHATARLWQAPGHRGTVGFIASMTQPFCSSCNRLRLTADGNLKVCLFGAAEVSLRDALRAGASRAELEALVRAALQRKLPQHAAPPTRLRAAAGPWARPRPAAAARAAARAGARGCCSLSHVDAAGRAQMVDVGDKPVTARRAEAACRLRASAALLRLLRADALAKGSAAGAAQLAGVQAAKRAAELLPLCHQLPLQHAAVRLALPAADADAEGAGGWVELRCAVRCEARTGAEMEALLGAAVAALALYDMGKAVDKHMRIGDLRLVSKTGGKADFPPPAPADTQRLGPDIK